MSVCAIVSTASIMLGINSGNACPIPSASPTTISIAASVICGKSCNIMSIICGAKPDNMLNISGNILTSVVSKALTPSIRGGNSSFMSCGIYAANSVASLQLLVLSLLFLVLDYLLLSKPHLLNFLSVLKSQPRYLPFP